MDETKIIAVQADQGEFLLTKNNVQSFCPKLAPFPVGQTQGLDGRVQYTFGRSPCNTLCPFASIVEKEAYEKGENGGSKPIGKRYFYVIECEGGLKEIQLEKIVPKEKSGSKSSVVRSLTGE